MALYTVRGVLLPLVLREVPSPEGGAGAAQGTASPGPRARHQAALLQGNPLVFRPSAAAKGRDGLMKSVRVVVVGDSPSL